MTSRVTGTDERTTRWLILCGVLTTPVLAVFIIIAASLTPGYSHLSETVSQLGAQGRPHPEVMSTGFIILGLLGSGFAFGLYRRLDQGIGAKVALILLVICGVGSILTGIFQEDSKAIGAVENLEGSLHSIFARTAVIGLLGGMLAFARVVHRNPSWRGFTQFSLAVVALNLLISLLFLLGPFVTVEGVLQRSLHTISLIWIGAVSFRGLRAPRATKLWEA